MKQQAFLTLPTNNNATYCHATTITTITTTSTFNGAAANTSQMVVAIILTSHFPIHHSNDKSSLDSQEITPVDQSSLLDCSLTQHPLSIRKTTTITEEYQNKFPLDVSHASESLLRRMNSTTQHLGEGSSVVNSSEHHQHKEDQVTNNNLKTLDSSKLIPLREIPKKLHSNPTSLKKNLPAHHKKNIHEKNQEEISSESTKRNIQFVQVKHQVRKRVRREAQLMPYETLLHFENSSTGTNVSKPKP
ncbi:hypothetical protein FDP41_011567 [Naegleria fowleri]|uniref:Uncharacterized protein n=1 Tax=Naegleria fowleri TaxID=5763 RepID=A0A6A5BZF1_NAEFO|nr:uncharacterized protein FDP41_011567 [Naegleria fowleri]KAF0982637.1 hypothetical protein FDP41_011567 [Naegleria fowleri]